MISMGGVGEIRINQEPVAWRDLGTRLREIFSTRGDRTIFLNADPNLLFNEVGQIIDIVKGAGASNIGLMTAQVF